MFLQNSPLLSSVVRMELDVKCFTMAWSLGRFALAQGEKGRCTTSAFHMVTGLYVLRLYRQRHRLFQVLLAQPRLGLIQISDNDAGNDEAEQPAH